MRTALLTFFLFLLLAACAAAAEQYIPTKLELFDGSATGGLKVERWDTGIVRCIRTENGPEGERRTKHIAAPTIPEWQAFYEACEQIGVWNWQPEYIDPLIADGKQWSVKIEYEDENGRVTRSIRSQGSNSYPPDGQSITAGQSTAYTAFWDAVKDLVCSPDLMP